ncbi:MAG: AMP-binding protein [Pseudobdellovibrio sp.]
MNPFDFSAEAENQLLINPKASFQEQSDLRQLKAAFEYKYQNKNYFLVPSSGSSKGQNESVRLIALHQNAIISSAKRVNAFFNLTRNLTWGLVLPTFHVAGLGVYARAFASGASVFAADWSVLKFKSWILQNQIHLISLVPTQVFDIVQNQIICPEGVQIVFVGAAALSAELKQKAFALKWPIIETYGMTEAASMVAVQVSNRLQIMSQVEVSLFDNKLKIKTESLMTCSVQKVDQEIQFKTLDNGWLQTEDRVFIYNENGIQYLQLLGRDSDFVKIFGEGVSLVLLRQILKENNGLALVAVTHERSEYEIALVAEMQLSDDQIKIIISEFNQQVRPFENIKRIYKLEQIPRSDLGKIKFKSLEELIKGKPYEKL